MTGRVGAEGLHPFFMFLCCVKTVGTWKDNIQFILVEPAEPGNVGAAARAIKNMGFTNLGLVNPPDILSGEARWMAHNACDVLNGAQVFRSLAESVRDKALVVGTTRRTGSRRGLMMHPDQVAVEIYRVAGRNKVAVVFGREDRGLLNEEVHQCGVLITIPAGAAHPSLNLAQAVMIVSYEISRAPWRMHEGEFRASQEAYPPLVDQAELEYLFERLSRILLLLEYLPRGDEDLQAKIMLNIKRFIGRAGLTRWELKMLHGLCSQAERKWKG